MSSASSNQSFVRDRVGYNEVYHVVIFTGSTFVDAQRSIDVAAVTRLMTPDGRLLSSAMM